MSFRLFNNILNPIFVCARHKVILSFTKKITYKYKKIEKFYSFEVCCEHILLMIDNIIIPKVIGFNKFFNPPKRHAK